MDFFELPLFQIILEIFLFILLTGLGIYLFGVVKNSKNNFLNPKAYLPDEELHSIRQVYYLIMMGLCFVIVLYAIVFNSNDLFYITIFDVVLSLYIAITIDKTSTWHKLLVLLLIPFGSLTYLIFGYTLISWLDIVHVPVFIYMMKYYFDGFKKYTEANSLGITIVLLFVIVFLSFLFTVVAEGVNPLDSLVMVSNAFTSNGYAVLGKTIPGKLNSILLVWSGYLISGVGTATLTVAILSRYYNKRFDELEELIKKNNKD